MHQHARHHDEVHAHTDRAIARLREAGERVTHARREILELLAGSPEHISADDVVSQLTAARPASTVHRTTVYRTLERFVDLGVAVEQRLPGGATGYHLTTEGHLHGHCVSCRVVVALPTDILQDLAPTWAHLDAATGFDVYLHRSTLLGVCRDCR